MGDPGDFFLFSDNQSGMTAVPVGQDLGPDDDYALLAGELRPEVPVEFRHNVGSVPGDIVMGGSTDLWLISTHVRDTLVLGGFTGWATYPVVLRRKRGEEIPGYHGLAITGRAKPISQAAFLAGLAAHGAAGMVARLASDDDDLFLEGRPPAAAIVVRGNVARALRAAKVTNLHLTAVG
jgi:hypothetical protein